MYLLDRHLNTDMPSLLDFYTKGLALDSHFLNQPRNWENYEHGLTHIKGMKSEVYWTSTKTHLRIISDYPTNDKWPVISTCVCCLVRKEELISLLQTFCNLPVPT